MAFDICCHPCDFGTLIHLSSIVIGDTMALNREYIRLYPPFGYSILHKNIILLGSTTKKTTHLVRVSREGLGFRVWGYVA